MLQKHYWLSRWLLLLILTGAVWFPARPVWADIAQIKPGIYMAGIPTDQFQFFAAPEGAGRQRSANWCWAACIQMVLNYKGLYITQEEIVTKVYGQLIDQPAGPQQIMQALNGWAPDRNGGYAAVVADPYNLGGPALVTDLANRYPLIVGLKGNPVGHAYVLTGVTYRVDPYNNPIFNSVVLRNPWPGSPSREELSWQEFMSRVMFTTRVHILRL